LPSQHGRFSDDERREVELEYLDSIKEFRNGDGHLVPGEFVIATAARQ